MKKSKGVAILLAVLLVLAGLSYYASIILSSTGKGEDKNIKLGLDLAGGVSITYQVESENPTSEQMKDTIYKLQKRVEGYSTEASVYQEGDDRITVEIPGVKDANKILDELGKPGSLEFRDPDGNVYMTGNDVRMHRLQHSRITLATSSMWFSLHLPMKAHRNLQMQPLPMLERSAQLYMMMRQSVLLV